MINLHKLKFNSLSIGFFLMVVLYSFPSLAQFRVTGTIVSKGDPLPGVTIKEKGTSNGTTSSVTGQYEISVSTSDAVLEYSFIGFEPESISVNGRTTINVSLGESTEQLSDVVVTALGIKRSERSLGYSVGSVSGDDVREVNHENFLTAIAGRVPGVQVSQTGDAGSTVDVIIRGQTSLNGDNQPLYVVDGVPISSTTMNITEAGDRNNVDYGNAISDIDPDNIESISILKGPNAAALYGSRAAHGVVLITTKKGTKAEKLGVSVNSSTVFDIPHDYFKLNTSLFAPGTRPYTPDNHPTNSLPGNPLLIDDSEDNWVGPELDKGYDAVQWNSPLDDNGDPIAIPLVSHPNNFQNFYQTGITSTNNVAVSNRTDDASYRFSYTNMYNRGLIPETGLRRHNFQAVTSFHLTKDFNIGANVNYASTYTDNRASGGRGNPGNRLANMNPYVDINDLKDYWEPGEEDVQQRSWSGDNPWFLVNEIKNGYNRSHVWGNVRADWNITKHIDLMVRHMMDTRNDQRETKISKSYTNIKDGYYGLWRISHYERNTDFLASYHNKWSDFDFSGSLGGNLRYTKNTNFSNTSQSGLDLPGLFNLVNIGTPLKSNLLQERGMRSLYALTSVGFREMIYLEASGRNDWSSTLPPENRSYFYPSVSLSLLMNKILNMPSYIDLFKFRGGVAQAGKDAEPYQLRPVLGVGGGGSGLSVPNTLLNPQLKPEIKKSKELGTDLAFAQNRIRASFTYYESDNRNQILSVQMPYSTGYVTRMVNAGLVRSKGVEGTLGFTPTSKSSAIQWDIDFNISRNRTTIVHLTEEMEGNNQPFVQWEEAKGGSYTYVGGTMGDIYDRQLVRVEDPNSEYYMWPLLEPDGSWNDMGGDIINLKKVANYNPKFTMGMQTSVSFKGFTLSANLDWRNGGSYISQTYRYTESDMHGQRFLDLTFDPGSKGLTHADLPQFLKENAQQYIIDGIYNAVGGPLESMGGFEHTEGGITLHDGVFNPGVIPIRDGSGNIIDYQENLGGPGTQYIRYGDNYPWSFNRVSTFDASFIKLREISISYRLPSSLANSLHLEKASVSVFSRNILIWTKAKNGLDPEHSYQPSGSNGLERGIEFYNTSPLVLPVGVKLSVDF